MCLLSAHPYSSAPALKEKLSAAAGASTQSSKPKHAGTTSQLAKTPQPAQHHNWHSATPWGVTQQRKKRQRAILKGKLALCRYLWVHSSAWTAFPAQSVQAARLAVLLRPASLHRQPSCTRPVEHLLETPRPGGHPCRAE